MIWNKGQTEGQTDERPAQRRVPEPGWSGRRDGKSDDPLGTMDGLHHDCAVNLLHESMDDFETMSVSCITGHESDPIVTDGQRPRAVVVGGSM